MAQRLQSNPPHPCARSNKDVVPIMKAVGYVKKDWLESPLLGNLKARAAGMPSIPQPQKPESRTHF
jgi:hypothetical protein